MDVKFAPGGQEAASAVRVAKACVVLDGKLGYF